MGGPGSGGDDVSRSVRAGGKQHGTDGHNTDVYDGGDTHLARAYEVEQTWGRNQDDYLNRNAGMVRLSELWYRHYEDAHVLALPDGSALEYREDNPYHYAAALTQGLVQVQKALLQRVRVSIWLGPHKLMDAPSPFPMRNFPYVPFWCFRKDRSRAPYGLIRDMRGPQDQIIDLDIFLYEILNSVKVEIDNDALDLSQNTYQEVAQNISSLRSMTVLNANRRNANGFRVTREHALASQVFQLVQERKRRIEEVGASTAPCWGLRPRRAAGLPSAIWSSRVRPCWRSPTIISAMRAGWSGNSSWLSSLPTWRARPPPSP